MPGKMFAHILMETYRRMLISALFMVGQIEKINVQTGEYVIVYNAGYNLIENVIEIQLHAVA